MADFQKRLTVQGVVSRVMGSFGLPVPNSVFASTDSNVIQMITLLNDVGEKLLTEADWQFLEAEHEITTTTDTTYAIPSDLDHYVADSQWNQSTKMPMTGPLTERDWQAIKARGLGGGTLTIYFKIANDLVEFLDAPGAGQVLTLPYRSRAWVQTAQGTLRDNVQSAGDTILYDPRLIRAALTLEWMKKKGFDTSSASAEYIEALEAASTRNEPGQTLSLVPGGNLQLLGLYNIPATGYGS